MTKPHIYMDSGRWRVLAHWSTPKQWTLVAVSFTARLNTPRDGDFSWMKVR